MIPENLVDKQTDMQVRSQEKRSKQNRKNASGRRKRAEPKPRSTRRTVPDLIRGILAEQPSINPRAASFLLHQAWCFQNGEKPPSWAEFFQRESSDPSDDPNRFAEAARQFPLPEIPQALKAPETDEVGAGLQDLQSEIFRQFTS